MRVSVEMQHALTAASFAATCPKCDNRRAYFMQIQIRSADEPSTTFFVRDRVIRILRWLTVCRSGARNPPAPISGRKIERLRNSAISVCPVAGPSPGADDKRTLASMVLAQRPGCRKSAV